MSLMPYPALVCVRLNFPNVGLRLMGRGFLFFYLNYLTKIEFRVIVKVKLFISFLILS